MFIEWCDAFTKNLKKMKKISLIIIAALSFSIAGFAQNVDDALRYSRLFYSGSARFMSMGGAFTALGGDLSSLSQNPAGLGMFRSSEITITPQLFHINTKSGFNNNNTEDYLYDFNLAQGGLVANIIRNNSQSGLISLNFGYAYNRTNNFNQSTNIEGTATKSSLLDYWTERAYGYYKDELQDEVQDAFLGWNTWLIDTLSGSGTSYGTVYSNYGDDPPSVYGQHMRRILTTQGYAGEHLFSIGGNYSNKLYFGASLGITKIFYESRFEHLESTDEELSSKFTDFNYTYYYKNEGTGYTLKFGTIYKPIETLRIGVAFHSPTLYKIYEEVDDNISSYFSDRAIPYESNNGVSGYEYALTTPFRAMAGVALQVQKLALLSADYEFVDYRTARFSETGDGFEYGTKNHEIKNSLRPVHNLRLGAEVRLSSIYLRAGYAHYGKAWNEGELNENLAHNSLSLGIGFREQNVYADLGLTRMNNTEKYILYDSNLETVMSDLDICRTMINITFGYRFGY